jgi:hypothetical protein
MDDPNAVIVAHPGNGAVRIPVWLIKWVGPLVFGGITLAVSSLVNNIVQQKQQDDTLTAIKQDLKDTKQALQDLKTMQDKEHLDQEEFQLQYNVDRGSYLDWQRVVKQTMDEQHNQVRSRLITLQGPKMVPKSPGSPILIPEKSPPKP